LGWGRSPVWSLKFALTDNCPTPGIIRIARIIRIIIIVIRIIAVIIRSSPIPVRVPTKIPTVPVPIRMPHVWIVAMKIPNGVPAKIKVSP